MTTPAGDRCFIRDAHPFVKIHFNPKTEGWRQVRNRRRTPSRTKHSSTCSESRTAFNLIWVYLHKSLLDSNVLGIDACVEKLYTARQRDFLRNFHPPWDWVGSKRGSVRSVGKYWAKGNRNEIFCRGMRNRVRLMVSPSVYISRISGIIGKSEFILRNLR